MEIEGRKRSEQFEDRGRGAGFAGGGRGGVPIQALFSVLRLLGPKGTVVAMALVGVGYFVLPSGVRQQLFGAILGGQRESASGARGAGSVCGASTSNAKACDFSRVVLASTEEVWTSKFQSGLLPRYGREPSTYELPTLVVFADSVGTGCGNATSDVGPFYCPADRKLYIDPSFYDVMEKRLRAPGDFAQAYVIAHEVGHHVQNLIGVTAQRIKGETKNQNSVRVELQADCFAGVWGHTARGSLAITDDDLKEAVDAAHAIGDDTLGHANADDYTHGTSAQRMRWFRLGFQNGDARQCDTFRVVSYGEL
ncbi:MAG: neutral zinc metallopeptidase [Polyangiaceae bacterium]